MAKKSFSADLGAGLSPATAFISSADPAPAVEGITADKKEAAPAIAPAAGGSTPLQARAAKEPKTRRLNSLLRPSLYEWLTEEAAAEDRSVNDELNIIIAAAKAAREGGRA